MIPNRLAFTFLLLTMLIILAPDIIAADSAGQTEAQQSGYPPVMHELVIDSAGARMAALAYVAAEIICSLKGCSSSLRPMHHAEQANELILSLGA